MIEISSNRNAFTPESCRVSRKFTTKRLVPRMVNGWETLVAPLAGARWESKIAPLFVGQFTVGEIRRCSLKDAIYFVVPCRGTIAHLVGSGVEDLSRESQVLTLAEARRIADRLVASVAALAPRGRALDPADDPTPAPAAEPTADAPARLSHAALPALLAMIRSEGAENLYLVGPAGSGKTSLAADVAAALGRPFGVLPLSGGVTESHVLGRVLPRTDGSWGYCPSEFVRIYETGGVFLLDEIDAADPNVLVSINAALANGFLVDPEGRIRKRHADTVILAAANTYGTGPDAEYVGRNALDAATRDRFVLNTATISYDARLEHAIAAEIVGDAEARHLLARVEKVRKAIADNRLRRIVSTRFVVRAAKAFKAGATPGAIFERLVEGWTAAESGKILEAWGR